MDRPSGILFRQLAVDPQILVSRPHHLDGAVASQGFSRSPFTLLAMAVLVALAMAWGAGRASREGSAPTLPPDCGDLSPDECRALLESRSDPIPSPTRPTILAAGEVCRNVGYLCATVEATGSLRLLHWPAETSMIRILVPEPIGLPTREARALQAAAVKGIRTWNGHPIPVSVRTRPWADAPDVTVEWVRTLDGGRLGRAEVEWARRGEEARFRVIGFVIASEDGFTFVHGG